MIPIATFRKDDRLDGPLLWLLWEPRSGVVWTRRNFGEPPRSWPTFYFAKRRFAVDAMIADVYGGRYPQTFQPISRRPPKAVSPRFRANSVSAPDGRPPKAVSPRFRASSASAPAGRDGTAQPPKKKAPR